MYSKIYSAALAGMDCFLVQVETDVSDGLPHLEMVGALSAETREARERVRTALKNAGVRIPPKRITVSLSPADRRKEGTGFDLAVAAGILSALGLAPQTELKDAVIAGEVCLDGTVRGVRGVMAMASLARREGKKRLFVPRENAGEGAVMDGLLVIPVDSVSHLLSMWKDESLCRPVSPPSWEEEIWENGPDFCQIGGQAMLKRAAETACAGMHNLLMVGSAGAGKSMIARRIPTILPRLTREESIEISTIYSIGGYLPAGDGRITIRPFRSPHHTVTAAGLAGGGRIPRPGEMSLAHGGVLFLDELPEFRSEVLETLRQPLEDRKLTLVRAGASYEFPADFILVAAMNACRCGYYPDRNLCRCTEGEIHRYLGRLSRPLLDRLDICVEVTKATYGELSQGGETSAAIRSRVERAVKRQRERFRGTGIRFNARIPVSDLERFCPLDERAEGLLQKVYEKLTFSARGLHSLRRVARTLADLEEKEVIGYEHVNEAVFYRSFGERLWMAGGADDGGV